VWSERGPLRYERLTWPEVRRAAAECVAYVDELLAKPLPERRQPEPQP